MSEWIEYDGSDEQIRQIKAAKNGYMVRGDFYPKVDGLILHGLNVVSKAILNACATHFLLCEPHSLYQMICEQAKTGQPVWIRTKSPRDNNKLLTYKTTKPNWYLPDAEYSFEPFEEQTNDN